MKILIPLVEEKLEIILRRKLKELKTNVDIIDKVFPTASETNKQKLKQYIGEEQLKVVRGFPRNQNHIPAFVILLGSEQETISGIGDYVGESIEFDEDNTVEVLPVRVDSDGRRYVKTSKKPVENVNFVDVGGNSFLDGFAISDNRRGIVVLDDDVIPSGSDEVAIDYDFRKTGYETYGTQFHANYRIETWTENGDLTTYLYHLLKSILFQSRMEIEEDGIILQKINGADFEPLPDYFPAFVYRRALMFETTYFADFDVSFPYISSISAKEGKSDDN